MQMKRRDFLKHSAVGVGSVLVGSSLASAAESNSACFDPFERVSLGQTKLKPTRFCLGTGMRGGNRQSNHTRLGKAKLEALLQGAYERGTRAFDLADLYGTHSYLLPALKGVPRDQITIVSKIWWQGGGIPDQDRPDADVVVQRFLKEIGTDYLDLVLLHCVTSGKWPEELRKQMDIMAQMKSKGLIRAHGVSCHTLPALEAAAAEPWVDSVHARINPFGMSMDGAPEKVVPALKKLRAAGKGVIGMKIIGEGRLRNDEAKRDESIQYVLNLGCVDVLLVGCETVAEVDDLVARVRKVPRPA